MKRPWLAAFVLLISFAFVSMAFAQAKPAEKPTAEKAAAEKAAPAPAEKPAAPAPDEKKEEKPAEKPKPKMPSGFIGLITNIDNMAQTLTVKGAKEPITVDTTKPTLKGYKSIEQMKVGDKVAVKYGKKEGLVITKIASAKPAKKEKAAPAPVEKKDKPTAKKGKNFGDVDANKDGKITIEELTVVFINVSPEAFKKFDKNADGALDQTEFQAVK